MATVEDRLKVLEGQMRRATAVANALEGHPSDATLALPHNDSLWYADNIDDLPPMTHRQRTVIPILSGEPPARANRLRPGRWRRGTRCRGE